MSVLVADLQVFEAVYSRATSYQYHKVCDLDYCNTLSLEDRDLQGLVKDWLYLNEYSYNRRYEEGNILPEMPEMLTFNYTGKKISTYQMLKYLNCIYYNIEIETIEQGRINTNSPKVEIDWKLKKSYEILIKAIEEIQSTIIGNIPEYKSSKWCEV